MKLDVYLGVADFIRPDHDKSKLEVSGVTARYTFAGSRVVPGKWSFLVAELEVPDHVGLDTEGGSVVVMLEIVADDPDGMLPGDVQILGGWLDADRHVKAMRYVPAKNLIAHAERKDFGFALIRRHGYGFKAG